MENQQVFQGSHFVFVDVGGLVLGWVYGCVNEVCMKVIGCGYGGVCVEVDVCLRVWVDWWVSEIWTSGIVNMLIPTISMSTVC